MTENATEVLELFLFESSYVCDRDGAPWRLQVTGSGGVVTTIPQLLTIKKKKHFSKFSHTYSYRRSVKEGFVKTCHYLLEVIVQ